MTITKRVLAPEEAQKAIDAGGPLKDLQVDPAKLADMRIAVVEVDGTVVAYWVVWYALHVEPLFIREDYRKSPSVVGGIVEQMRELAVASGEPVAYCEIAEENLEVVGNYADRLGFMLAPGQLFYLPLVPKE